MDKRGKINVCIQKEELRDLYLKEKLPLSKIAEKFGCSKNTIAYWLRKYKIKLREQSQSMKLFVNKPGIRIPKDELYDDFKNKKLRLSEIAKKYDCKICTAVNRLRKYHITHKFSNCKRVAINKKTLEGLYIKDRLTTYQIAELYVCCQATIWKMLKKYGIKRRNPYELNSRIPSKAFLKKLYITQGMSTWGIERVHGYCRSTLHRNLRKYGMIRNRAQSHMTYPRKDFSGDLIEKAYLIGFRLGDLRVRKKWENSETIHVDCASSIKEQIELIKRLFSPYGHVWISKPNKEGNIQIECSLNLSFGFLLDYYIPKGLLRDKKQFFAFLAGFTDAEGCISINNKNQAWYSLTNQDKELLKIIRGKLINLGIDCPNLNLNSKKGAPRVDGEKVYYSNKDCWMVTISKKANMYQLLVSIEPYLKHGKKVKNLKLCKANIIERNRRFGA